MIKLVIRILARMFKWPYVWLEDDKKRVYRVRVTVTPFGPTIVNPGRGGRAKLREDGTVGLGSSIYSKYDGKWVPANKAAHKLFPIEVLRRGVTR
jgi:hypothetical protein